MEAAAHAAITDGATPPFHLRSALVGEVVAFYDAVRRQRQDVASFERLVLEPLALEAESEGDAGAERMLRQTRFLAATFRGYEARRDALGATDEHTLRDWLIGTRLARPYRRVVVAVADQSRDDNGLWNADFDLLTRLPDLEAVDVVATEAMLATGWFERLHDLLPGLTWGQTPNALGRRGQTPPSQIAILSSILTRRACWCPPGRRQRSAIGVRPQAVLRQPGPGGGTAGPRTAGPHGATRRADAGAAGPHRRRLRPAVALHVPGPRGVRAGRRAV